jgi:GcrA cell cycle regulator
MDAALIRHVADGKSLSQAAVLINAEFKTQFSRNAAIGRAHRLGIKAGVRYKTMRKPKDKGETRAPKPQRPRAVRRNPIVAPIEVEQPEPRCVEVISRELDILTIEPGECRYPSEGAPFTFCGHPVRGESSYCGPHHSLCHGHTPAPRRPDALRTGPKRSSFFLNFEAA